MQWWQVSWLRVLEFRNRVRGWFAQFPSLWLIVLWLLLAALFLAASMYRAVLVAPAQTDVFQFLFHVTMTATVIGFVLLNPRTLKPPGLPPVLPLTDGAVIAGSALPLLVATGLLGLAILLPALLALVHGGTVSTATFWLALISLPLVFSTAGWLSLVLCLAAGRARVAMGIMLVGIFWFAAGRSWLDVLVPGVQPVFGLTGFLACGFLSVRWMLYRFVWPIQVTEGDGKPPPGHRRPFPRGSFAWTALEWRLLLRDRNMLIYLLMVLLTLWFIVGVLYWRPFLAVQDVSDLNQRLAHISRYFMPAVYIGAFFLATGSLRARGLDLSRELWVRSLPMQTSDYVLGKGIVHLSVSGGAWVMLWVVASLLAHIPWGEVHRFIGRAALFALVTYSLAYLWGTIVPLADDDSLQGLVHITLFALSSVLVYQGASLLEAASGHPLAPLATGIGLGLTLLALAVAVEQRRRMYGT